MKTTLLQMSRHNLNQLRQENGLLKNKQGVYGLFLNNVCLYVGFSNDLRSRLLTHRCATVSNRMKYSNKYWKIRQLYELIGKNRENVEYAYFETNNAYDEYEQIQLLKPLYNIQGSFSKYKKPLVKKSVQVEPARLDFE